MPLPVTTDSSDDLQENGDDPWSTPTPAEEPPIGSPS
jgi:hypothetical protein